MQNDGWLKASEKPVSIIAEGPNVLNEEFAMRAKTKQIRCTMIHSKNTVSKLIFLIIVLVYFTAMAFKKDAMLLVFKPLLMTGLLLYFLSATKGFSSSIKLLTVGAIVFSFFGDTLLMFAGKNELFFLLGLSAFLIAHIFYILCFHKIKVKENVEGRWQWSIVVAIYYFFIILLLMPHLGSMKIPVLIYGLVISFMLLVAALLYDLPDNKTARYILTGALLFVISDSVLAINKFYLPFETAGWIIMLTYVAAQYLLVSGVIRYMRSVNN